MASYKDTLVGVEGDWVVGEDTWAVGMNNNLDLVRVLLSKTALAIQNAPPASLVNSTLYITGPIPTGTWVGQVNKLAFYKTNAWYFVTPAKGSIVRIETTKSYYQYTGTEWVPLETIPEQLLTTALTGAVVFNLKLGRNFFTNGATGNIVLSITNAPTSGVLKIRYRFKQDATGSRTITFPAGTQWPGGTTPVATVTANALDEFELVRHNSLNWTGRIIGQNFS